MEQTFDEIFRNLTLHSTVDCFSRQHAPSRERIIAPVHSVTQSLCSLCNACANPHGIRDFSRAGRARAVFARLSKRKQ